MNITDIINEELSATDIEFSKQINGGLAKLSKSYAKIKDVVNKNQDLSGPLSTPVGEIEQVLNGLYASIKAFSMRKKGENQTGIGTQEKIVKPVTPPTIPQKAATPAVTTATNVKPV